MDQMTKMEFAKSFQGLIETYPVAANIPFELLGETQPLRRQISELNCSFSGLYPEVFPADEFDAAPLDPEADGIVALAMDKQVTKKTAQDLFKGYSNRIRQADAVALYHELATSTNPKASVLAIKTLLGESTWNTDYRTDFMKSVPGFDSPDVEQSVANNMAQAYLLQAYKAYGGLLTGTDVLKNCEDCLTNLDESRKWNRNVATTSIPMPLCHEKHIKSIEEGLITHLVPSSRLEAQGIILHVALRGEKVVAYKDDAIRLNSTLNELLRVADRSLDNLFDAPVFVGDRKLTPKNVIDTFKSVMSWGGHAGSMFRPGYKAG